MEKYMKPDRFSCDPNSTTASKEWKHWFVTFDNFLKALKVEEDGKLCLLINHIDPSVYDYIAEYDHYNDAIEALKNMYIKPKNEIFARHLLATRKQKPGETLDQFFVSLKELSKDCNYKDVKALQYQSESIRDAFINGLTSNNICQRLLENKTLDLQTAFDQARALDIAQRSWYADYFKIASRN